MMSAHSPAERRRIAGRARSSVAVTLSRQQSAGLEPDQRFLEIGCGSGIHLAALARANNTIDITGLEPDIGFATEAMARVRGFDNARIRIGHAERLPFEDATFDAYYARLVYQHCSDPLQALREARRVLRRSGVCMVDDIDRGWFTCWPEPEPLYRLWRQIESAQQDAGGDPFIGRKLASMMHHCGFRSIRTDIQVLTTDGKGIPDVVADLGESLLDMLPVSARAAGRAILADWAAEAATEPEAHQLSMGWFMVTGRQCM